LTNIAKPTPTEELIPTRIRTCKKVTIERILLLLGLAEALDVEDDLIWDFNSE
jgi:hypothetical protein